MMRSVISPGVLNLETTQIDVIGGEILPDLFDESDLNDIVIILQNGGGVEW